MSQLTIAECEHLRSEAQEMRVSAIRTRIAAAITFCDVAESQARWYPPAHARASLERIWHSIGELQQHIDDPRHVAPNIATNLRQNLESVRTRATGLGLVIGTQRASSR